MAAHEWRVVSELIRSKDMSTATRLGLSKDILISEPEAAQLFDYIWNHYHNSDTYRQFPSLTMLRRRFPSFEMTSKVDDGQLATLIKELKGMALETDMRSLVSFFEELVEDDPREAIQVMQSHLSRVQHEHSNASGFSMQQIVDQVEAHYEGALKGTIYGIPWVWDCLTQDTLGKNKEEFTIIYGRMKSMKTWVLMVNACFDYMLHNRRVLFWSREMNEMKMALRAGSIFGGIDYQCLKNGTLPKPLYEQAMATMREMARLLSRSREALEELRKGTKIKLDHNVPDIMFLCGRGAPTNLEEMDAIVQAFNPDIVYFDSFYRLSCATMARMKSDHERQREITVQIKERTINWGLPVVATTQANREGEKTYGETMRDMGRTDAAGQEADLILRVLYKKSNELFEDDYEGYWKEHDLLDEEAAGRKEEQRAVRG